MLSNFVVVVVFVAVGYFFSFWYDWFDGREHANK